MQYYQHRFETIEEYLHHRPPYLLVEKIDSIEDREITTSKQVKPDEPWIEGHFSGAHVFPGAIMQELVTQTAGILIAANYNPMESYVTSNPRHNEYALGVLVKVDSARYRGFARPGDRLDVKVTLNEITGNLFDFSGRIHIAEKEIMKINFRLCNIASSVITDKTDGSLN
ncbi:MAG: hypothetical protein CMJ76_09880 [Planctomycetaceae bacterium]|nr:hypothetical protein [Planctomycetaceae bacterium]|tara:strand:+ start:2561 stop:3070 length:510 start_codon:yes stop_codon:yes gene_type:complete